MFPSPPRTSYFLIGFPERSGHRVLVSVPSGDFLFFNHSIMPQVGGAEEMFPSPLGTSYFLIKYDISLEEKQMKVSVPSGDFLFFNPVLAIP